MIKTTIKTILLCLCAAFAANVMAQTTTSGYFIDGYLQRYQMNPAIGNSRNFVSMPGLSNINVAERGTLGVKDIFYNINGKTTTFLNPEVSTEEAMSRLKGTNHVGVNTKIDLLSFGFKGFGGYNTFSVNARANAAVKLPSDIFRLLKEGVSNSTYNIADISAHADAYAEIALNHSHQITEKLRIGVTLKGLVGVGNVDADLKKAQLELRDDAWDIVTDATVQANVKNLRFASKVSEETGNMCIDDVDIDKFGIAGFGAAIDLGAVYNLGDFELSAALLDFGAINWSNNYVASTDGEHRFTTDKYTFNVDDEATNNFDDELERMGDDLAVLYEMKDMGDHGSRLRMLATTVNIGAKYTLPTYKALSFGALSSTRLQGKFTWTELRLSANYTPCKFFSMGANVATGNCGTGFGWIINLHTTGFNLFAGMDYTCLKLAKPGVPENSTTSLNFGWNIPF
ncbi:MAG: DUF5723 family protein [Muribaculaceae bacterium]